jgi:hypothetical protein
LNRRRRFAKPNYQPPNHYRLLAIKLFESAPDTIEAAADVSSTTINMLATHGRATREAWVRATEARRRGVARAVNSIPTATYGEIGRRIVEFEQGNETRAGYAKELLKRLGQVRRRLTYGGRTIRSTHRLQVRFTELVDGSAAWPWDFHPTKSARIMVGAGKTFGPLFSLRRRCSFVPAAGAIDAIDPPCDGAGQDAGVSEDEVQ